MKEVRRYKRLAKKYRIEYGPFSAMLDREKMHKGVLINIGGGGVLFSSTEKYDIGTQLYIMISISGWGQNNGKVIKVVDENLELAIKAIAEVLRVDEDRKGGGYVIGAKFSGRVQM